MRRSDLAVVMGCAVVLVASCAQVTGLSDDYRFDLAPDGSAPADGAPPPDGSTPGDAGRDASRDQCGIVERQRAETALVNAGGERVPLTCRTCMTSSCCGRINQCNGDPTCGDSMRCVLGCQRDSGSGSSKQQCLRNCGQAFNQVVLPCVPSFCTGPVAACSLE